MDFSAKDKTETLLWLGCCGVFFFTPLTTLPTEICGIFILVVWIFSGKFLKEAGGLIKIKIIIPVALLIALPWLGLVYTNADGLDVAVKARFWLYAVAALTAIKTQKKPDTAIKFFLAGLALNCFVSLLQLGGVFPLKNGQPTGLLIGSSLHIPYTLFLTIGILIGSFYAAAAQDSREKTLYLLIMLLYFMTIGFTGGRSGYLAFMVLSPFIVYNLMGQKHILKILAVSTIIVALLLAFPMVNSRFAKASDDFRLYKQGDIDTSLGSRFHMWGIALSEIKNSPFFGIGTDGFKKSPGLQKNFKSIQYIDHPHNSFLYMMVSFGLLGLIAFCWLLYIMLKRGWKGRDSPLGFAVFAFTSVFIIGSLTDTQVLTFSTAMAFSFFAVASEAIHV